MHDDSHDLNELDLALTQEPGASPHSDLTRRGLLIGGAGVAAALTFGVAEAAAATANYTYQKQATGYWCSAAACRIAISSPLGRRDPGEPSKLPTQASLAKSLNLHPYDGDAPTTGLKDIRLVPKVLNNRIGLAGKSRRYRLRISPTGTLAEDLSRKVKVSIDAGYPVVINMNEVDGDSYAGHYIAIVGYSKTQYKIADPVTASRKSSWYAKDKIRQWNKLNRFVHYA